MTPDWLLDIRDLHVWYRIYGGYLKVLDGVHFSVAYGEKVALVGETGCGKTTTMKSILRVLPEPESYIDQGEILFKNKDILRMSYADLQRVRSKGIAMIFQDPTAALNPVFTIGSQLMDVIQYAIPRRERTKRQVKNIALKALKEVSLPDQERILGNYPIQLSGGMRQRVCISMAITTSRELLIADEPGTSLDVTIQDQILRLLKDLVEKRNTSVILITHSLGVARELANRIYVMYAGTMIEVAKTRELFSHPLHPYTSGLLASVPKITGGGIAAGIPGQIPDYLNPPKGCRFHPRCSKRMDICSEKKPGIYQINEDHFVSCYLYGKNNVTTN
jgi:peptide/nickel transport system ATP-binding protein